MTRLHRLLQLGNDDSKRAELVTQINELFKKRLGRARIRVEYTFEEGLTVLCGSVSLVPSFFKNRAKRIHEVDQEWSIICTWKGATDVKLR